MFIWVERYCERNRNKRIKREDGLFSLNTILPKDIKNPVWLPIYFVTGAIFVDCCYPIDELS
jgi:hypothetical protein